MSSGVAEVSPKYLADVATNGVPVGYKQTDVGVIPEHWGVSRLRDLLKEPPKYGINAPAVPLEGTLPVYIRITDISEDGYFKPSEKVGVRSPLSGLYQLADGDVVLARTGASVGKSYLYKENDGVLVYAGFLIKASPDKKKLEPRFLSQYLNTQRYWSWVTVNSMRSGQPGINANEYGDLLIPLPKIQEQTAIANALSDVDALISELEKLVAKKQAIKTATMQQLLTGRTRLPQFALRADGTPKGTKPSELGEMPADWEVKTVFELAGYQKSLFDDGDWIEAEHITSNGIRLIQTGNIGVGRYVEKDAKKYIFEESFEKLKCKELHEGDLLICRLAEPAGRACILPDIGEDKVITSVDVTIFRPSPELANREFYNQYFSSSDWFKSVLEQVGGTTHKRISRGALGRISVCYPNVEEQTAIATILSDMDVEIQALEQRLGKIRQIKQGMMQELLTGKTRLIQGSEVR
jgi:type I restriction enzyme S subunit